MFRDYFNVDTITSVSKVDIAKPMNEYMNNPVQLESRLSRLLRKHGQDKSYALMSTP